MPTLTWLTLVKYPGAHESQQKKKHRIHPYTEVSCQELWLLLLSFKKWAVVVGVCFTNISHRNVSVVRKSCGKSKNDRST